MGGVGSRSLEALTHFHEDPEVELMRRVRSWTYLYLSVHKCGLMRTDGRLFLYPYYVGIDLRRKLAEILLPGAGYAAPRMSDFEAARYLNALLESCPRRSELNWTAVVIDDELVDIIDLAEEDPLSDLGLVRSIDSSCPSRNAWDWDFPEPSVMRLTYSGMHPRVCQLVLVLLGDRGILRRRLVDVGGFLVPVVEDIRMPMRRDCVEYLLDWDLWSDGDDVAMKRVVAATTGVDYGMLRGPFKELAEQEGFFDRLSELTLGDWVSVRSVLDRFCESDSSWSDRYRMESFLGRMIGFSGSRREGERQWPKKVI